MASFQSLALASLLAMPTIASPTLKSHHSFKDSSTLDQCLANKLSPQASVVLPRDSSFVADSIRWTTLGAPSYSAVVNATSERDISASIECATQHGVPFLATGPRHGYSLTLSSIHEGLEINTAFLDHLNVDCKANKLTAGGSVTFEQVIDALYAVGKELPTGSCSCVGLVGGTLGGGVGRLSGLHGLILDSLLSVRVMLPNTTVVNASRHVNSELFWGLRGAGFNFGVVLEATYQIHDQVPQGLHFNADFIFPISQVSTYYDQLSQVSKAMPKELSILTLFNFDSDFNQTVITTNAVFAGSEREGRAAIQFLLDQKPIKQNLTAVPWNKLINAAGFGFTGPEICLRGSRRSQWAIGVNTIDAPTYSRVLDLFQQMIQQYPAARDSSVDVQLLPTQATLAVPDNATAYPYRSFVAHVLLEFKYSDATLDDAISAYARRIRDVVAMTAGTNGLQVYVSYSHGDESLRTLYSARKLPRLAALKKQIDPSGLFNAYHPLPTMYS